MSSTRHKRYTLVVLCLILLAVLAMRVVESLPPSAGAPQIGLTARKSAPSLKRLVVRLSRFPVPWRKRSQRARCVSGLKQLGTALRMYVANPKSGWVYLGPSRSPRPDEVIAFDMRGNRGKRRRVLFADGSLTDLEEDEFQKRFGHLERSWAGKRIWSAPVPSS